MIDDQIAFERLVCDLSVQFINLPPDRVNDAIRDALRVIGEGFDLDRCNFFRVQPDGQLTDPVSWARQGYLARARAAQGRGVETPGPSRPCVPGERCRFSRPRRDPQPD